MAGSGRQQQGVAGLDRDFLARRSADHQPGPTCRNAQYFVGRRMKMVKGIDAVSPEAAPAIGSKEPFETLCPVGAIEHLPIDDHRKSLIIRDPTGLLEFDCLLHRSLPVDFHHNRGIALRFPQSRGTIACGWGLETGIPINDTAKG